MRSAHSNVAGFDAMIEAGRRIIARFRAQLWATRLDLENHKRPTYFLSRWLFLRLLGFTYLIAFTSIWVQRPGLIGSHGILPANEYLAAVHRHFGAESYWKLPSLVWLWPGDAMLNGLCLGGVCLSVLQIAGVAQPVVLLALWAAYLSLVNVGADFLSFQWDALLLEAGLLAVFYAPRQVLPRPSREKAPPTVFRWLLAWLLFKLMFLSGATKLAYHDAAWLNLTALTYHYQTQPLPVCTSWYAHHLPLWFHKASCAIMFIIELVLPFFIAGPRRIKQIAFVGLAVLQLLIAITGNYNFFNILTLALCILLLDDAALSRTLPRYAGARFPLGRPPPRVAAWRRALAGAFGVVVALTGYFEIREELSRQYTPPALAESWQRAIRPLRSINGYGLFRVMTTARPEIVIEGSNDGADWKAYEFNWKPGDVLRRPSFVEPHQPRLDWQMWFAALAAPHRPMWFDRFVLRLLEGAPDVLALLEKNPFPEGPPRYIRAVLYDYRFTTSTERARTGAWWNREWSGLYLRPVSLPGG